MSAIGQDTLKARRSLEAGGKSYDYYSLSAVSDAGYGDISRLPYLAEGAAGEPAAL